MNIRFGVPGLFVLAMSSFGAIAWGGPQQLAAVQEAAPVDELPAWVMALPEGTPPRDNNQTNDAFIAIAQARALTNPGQRQTQYQRALTAATAGIAADPANPQSYLQAGEAHLGLGDFDSADQMFARALEIYPRYVLDVDFIRDAAWVEHFNAGIEALQAERRDEALAAFERANRAYDARPESFVELAALLLDDPAQVPRILELYDGAIAAIEARAERDDPDSQAVAEGWAPFLEVALYNGAHFRFSSGQYAEAAEVYRRIIERFPEDNGIVGPAVVSFAESGKVDEYVPLIESLLAREGLTPDDYMNIGATAYQAERMDIASSAFGKLHDKFPQDRNALSNYALTLYLANKNEELITAAQKLLEMEPYDQAPYRFLVNALYQADREAEAAALLQRMEGLPFDFAGVNYQPTQTGGVFLGQVTNNSATANSVQVRLHIVAPDGSITTSEPVSVPLAARGETAAFELPVTTTAQFLGYRYEVIP